MTPTPKSGESISVLAIDPGPERSAWVEFERGRINRFGLSANDDLRDMLAHDDTERLLAGFRATRKPHLAIEMIASYGMPVGREVFDTCVWIGRFIEAWGGPHTKVYRQDVKLHLCHNVRANDGNIRAALIDRFGPGKDKAIGKKASPGPLYGISGDVWAALGVAVTWADKQAVTELVTAGTGVG